MSEEENDSKPSVERVEVGASIEKVESPELEASPTVSEEKLRKAQLLDELTLDTSTTRELPKRESPKAQIPDKGELGKKLTIRLGKRYDVVNLKVFQGEKEEETGGGNTNVIHDKDEKRKDEISYEFFDPVPIRGKTENSLTKGKYLVRVHAYGQEAGDELEQEQVVDIQ